MSRALWNALGAVSALYIAVPAPGDLEVDCFAGVQTTERWPAGVSSIPWDITFTTNGAGAQSWTGPASPPLNGAWASVALAQKPGISALLDAADTWGRVIVPDAIDAQGNAATTQGGAASSIRFATPNLVERTFVNFPQSPGLGTFTAVPITQPPQCCQGIFRLTGTMFVPDTIRFESAAGGLARNTVDFVTVGRYWQAVLGQPTNALAVTAVRAVNGVITEFDIGFNACTEFWNISPPPAIGPCVGTVCAQRVPGPVYSWLAESRRFGLVLGDAGGTVGTQTWPTTAFADVQGVAAHEFGHALGLGHSYQDGRSNLGPVNRSEPTEFPTMFPNAQAARIAESYSYASPSTQLPGQVASGNWLNSTPGDSTTWPASTFTTEATTIARGVLGYSARTLELDDIAAIGRGYPTAGFTTRTAAINGVVSLAGQPYLGALVTATEMAFPNTIRASTLSYQSGKFDLRGLPPGRYALRVEPFPRGILNDAGVWPAYIAGACGANGQDFPAEYWNNGDVANERSSQVTVITLAAGALATANVVLDDAAFGNWASPVLTPLGASAPNAPPLAVPNTFAVNRRHMPVTGAIAASATNTMFLVDLRIDGSIAYANAAFTIVAAPMNTHVVRFGQLITVGQDFATQPTVFAGTLDANGFWQGSVPVSVTAGIERDVVQFEAQLVASAQPPAITNAVGVWFWF